jgi:hypothetical protein
VSGDIKLPHRAHDAEQAFLDSLGDDDEALVVVVRMALAAGRPALAGRAVQRIGLDSDDEDLLRARRAARLMCLSDSPDLVELDSLLDLLRLRTMSRAKRRARARLKGEFRQDPSKRRRR